MQESASTQLPVGYGHPGAPPSGRSGAGRLVTLGAGVFALGAVVLLGFYFAELRKASGVAEASAVADPPEAPVNSALQAPLAAAVERYLDAPLTLSFDGKQIQTTWRGLGMVVDPAALGRQAADLSAAGVTEGSIGAEYFLDGSKPVPVALDRGKGLEALVGLKDQHDRPASDARMDLEKRQVVPHKEGYGINVYASLASLDETARGGKLGAELTGGTISPQLTVEKLGNIDITNVLGWFETRYPPVEKDRNYNLKLAAEKVNGTILMPGEEWSFNVHVGDRTEKEGFRVAHVITAGEMIDGLAGGTCQVSSTLHGAAWFAGLELTSSKPHSRPSAYITMGLDATVVYPTTDLKLKNPYDFPVAIRYVVSQGTMRVEILGKKRPWDKVAFEREIKKEIPYETITREDDTLPVGSTVVEQIGFPGYELIRRRVYYKDGKEAKVEKWNVKYPPTTEYLRIGTNMDPNLVPPKAQKHHGIPDPGKKPYRMVQ